MIDQEHNVEYLLYHYSVSALVEAHQHPINRRPPIRHMSLSE